MTPDHHCPVDGCDYGAESNKSKNSVQGHINARDDPSHEWAYLSDQVDAQADEDQTDQDETDQDETDEEADEDETDMPTDSEYQTQQEQRDSDETDQGDQGDQGAQLPSLPVDPRTLMMGVAVAVVVWMLYQAVTSDSSAGADMDQATQSETPEMPDASGGEEAAVEGGLV